MDKRFALRASCCLFLIKKGKVLLLRRFNTGWEDGKYTLISGHLEGNETVKQAMIREAKEEAGINLNPKDLHVVHTMHRKSNNDREYIDFFLTADEWHGAPKIAEPDKCDDKDGFFLIISPMTCFLMLGKQLNVTTKIFLFQSLVGSDI